MGEIFSNCSRVEDHYESELAAITKMLCDVCVTECEAGLRAAVEADALPMALGSVLVTVTFVVVVGFNYGFLIMANQGKNNTIESSELAGALLQIQGNMERIQNKLGGGKGGKNSKMQLVDEYQQVINLAMEAIQGSKLYTEVPHFVKSAGKLLYWSVSLCGAGLVWTSVIAARSVSGKDCPPSAEPEECDDTIGVFADFFKAAGVWLIVLGLGGSYLLLDQGVKELERGKKLGYNKKVFLRFTSTVGVGIVFVLQMVSTAMMMIATGSIPESTELDDRWPTLRVHYEEMTDLGTENEFSCVAADSDEVCLGKFRSQMEHSMDVVVQWCIGLAVYMIVVIVISGVFLAKVTALRRGGHKEASHPFQICLSLEAKVGL